MNRFCFLCFLLFVLSFKLHAQPNKEISTMTKAEVLELSYEQLLELPLEDLITLSKIVGVSTDELLEMILNKKTTVASNTALTPREAPGILTVITEEEIKHSGARDLMDVLNLVPGIGFGVDVESVVGLGFRGIWGHEGKILMLLDGQELNELSYQTLQFGNHYGVEQISRIEIIRGPGSAIYGGNAELGVINIITKSAEEINGVEIGVSGGINKEHLSYSGINLSAGKKFNNLDIVLHGMYRKGVRSYKSTTDFYGTTYDMSDASDVNPLYLNLGVKYKNVSFRFISDLYHTTQLDAFGGYLDPEVYDPIPTKFNSYLSELRYDAILTEKVKNILKVNYRFYDSYRIEEQDLIAEFLDEENENYLEDYIYSIQEKPTQRISLHNSVLYQPVSNIDLQIGIEGYHESGKSENELIPYYNEDADEVMQISYQNFSGFIQSVIQTQPVNIIAGFRTEYHTLTGMSFVPRFGLTRAFEKIHFKALYSNAFRTPSIEAFSLNRDIEPEKTTVIEFETGIILSRNFYMSINLFDNTIKSPIVYIIDEESPLGESYINTDKTGSRGLESELKFSIQKKGYLFLNYAYYSTAGKNTIEDYQVFIDNEPERNSVLAFPNHKISANGHFKIMDGLSINPSMVYLSEVYGVSGLTEEEDVLYDRFGSTFLFHLNILWEDFFVSDLDFSAGIFNLFDTDYKIYQSYVARPALETNGRVLSMRLSYKF